MHALSGFQPRVFGPRHGEKRVAPEGCEQTNAGRRTKIGVSEIGYNRQQQAVQLRVTRLGNPFERFPLVCSVTASSDVGPAARQLF